MSGALSILGGGAFGWALADAAVRSNCEVTLWTRRADQPARPGVTITDRLADAAAHDLVFFAIPSPFVAGVARELGGQLDGSHRLVHISRGVVADGHEPRTLTQVLRATTPCRRIGALAGPIIARALAEGDASAGVVGSLFPEIHEAVHDVFSGQRLHVFGTDDVLGVELASSMVSLLSMAIGYGLEVGMGPATLAMVATRGMNEAARLGARFGARAETFHGLAGLGDLLAAFSGDGRPELEVGRLFAKGVAPDEVDKQVGARIEGLRTARWIAKHVARTGARLPVLQILADVFRGRTRADQALDALMARGAR